MKKLIILAVVVGLLGGAFGLSQYFKQHDDIEHADADYSLTASALVSQYENTNVEAEKAELGKIIAVTGIISKIDGNATDGYNILLGADQNVKCAIDPAWNDKVGSLKEGAEVTLKGAFSGIDGNEEDASAEEDDLFDLLSGVDVVLSRCVIMK